MKFSRSNNVLHLFPLWLFPWLLLIVCRATAFPEKPVSDHSTKTILRTWGIPTTATSDVNGIAILKMLEAFQHKFPHIRPVSSVGLWIPGRTMDVVPLMQIAGDVAPDVLYVNFRQSDTYIRSKFLYPLDKYIEDMVDLDVSNSHLLNNDKYLEKLKTAPHYSESLEWRISEKLWPIIRRTCPYKENCIYIKKWGASPASIHNHIWTYPQGTVIMALLYRRDLFAEAGLPDRAPRDIEEMLAWARILHHPENNQYGFKVSLMDIGWESMSFLYSYGGLMVSQDKEGNWRCVFDSEEAVDAYTTLSRFFLEPYKNEYGNYDSVVLFGQPTTLGEEHVAMHFEYISEDVFTQTDVERYGYGPVPLGPDGKRGSEFNAKMSGIYAGLIDNDKKRDAAWEYIQFSDGLEARKIRATTYIERGYARFLTPNILRQAGYEALIGQTPPGWIEAYEDSFAGGIPEPYGKNCQQVYTYCSKGINQIINDPMIKRAISKGKIETVKNRIRTIMRERVRMSNEKMLKIFTPDQKRKRRLLASVVALAILLLFFFAFRHVFRTFRSQAEESLIISNNSLSQKTGNWQFDRFGKAYALMLPALASILVWAYYPMLWGSVISFQDYNVRGFTHWVGMENFADVLHDREFWYALWISIKYSLMYIIFGFWTPIILAFLLTEVPRGKIIFRMIYYLPAVLTGVIVIFLWKEFYGPHGMINQILNIGIAALNLIPGLELQPLAIYWLGDPQFALFFCLLPTVWAGMGPGCLIYLAALKTIPDELYEAADVDGAGTRHKFFHIAIPSIKGLILINFVGVMIGVIRSGSEFMLAMTGGGPYTPYGQTEVVGLHIFWQAFSYLRFGVASAMGWVLGSLFIGFTLWQVQRLSRMEFRSAASATVK